MQGRVRKNELDILMFSFWWVRHAPVINNKNCCYGDNEVDRDTSNKKKYVWHKHQTKGNTNG